MGGVFWQRESGHVVGLRPLPAPCPPLPYLHASMEVGGMFPPGPPLPYLHASMEVGGMFPPGPPLPYLHAAVEGATL